MKKLVAILLNVLLSLTCAFGADVAMFRGNPQHTGVVAASAMPKGGDFIHPKWHFQTAGRIRSSAALVNGVVYFGSDDGYLYALRAGDGALVWKLKTAGAVSSSPAVAKGLVYFMSGDGVFRAIETKSGNVKWTLATGPELPFQGGWDWFLSSPVLSEESVVFAPETDSSMRSMPPPAKSSGPSRLQDECGRLRRLRTGLFTPAAWMARCTHSI